MDTVKKKKESGEKRHKWNQIGRISIMVKVNEKERRKERKKDIYI